jgi:uncharacterized protein YndB with AHSA1/START domain
MSKKKKVSAAKPAKKGAGKKPSGAAKKIVKQSNAAKKKSAPAVSAKKTSKPAVKASAKSSSPKKSTTLKSIVKKAIIKSVVKAVLKSKPAAKKTTAKTTAKSPAKKPSPFVKAVIKVVKNLKESASKSKPAANNKKSLDSKSKSSPASKSAPQAKSSSKNNIALDLKGLLKGSNGSHGKDSKSKQPEIKKSALPVKGSSADKTVPKKPEVNAKNIVKPSQNGSSKHVPVQKTAAVAEPAKKPTDKKPQGVLAITNTIPVASKNEISPSKIASISYSITNPVRKTDSYAVRPEKEPAGKFEMEFVVHASAEMLYEFLSTPSGLSEWFCDDLNIRNGIYTFIWDDQLQQARLLKTIDQQLVRFQWVDKMDGSYFEFKIQRDDLTNDISLIITDFADSVSDRESSKLLWNSQVEKLMHVIGSIF